MVFLQSFWAYMNNVTPFSFGNLCLQSPIILNISEQSIYILVSWK